MESSAYIALSRQGALRREMDVIANNLANMNTTAFKGEKMMFVEHLVKSKGGENFIPAKLSFTRDVAQYRDMGAGPIKTTGNPLDVAIQRDGYFVVDTPGGEQFTRNGRLTLDNEGQMVTEHGYPVMSTASTPFFLSPEDKNIHIAGDGTVSTSNGELGKIRVVEFEDKQKLQKQAAGLWTSSQTPQDMAKPQVVQGALESSNVNAITELTKMIDVHRAYDSVKSFIEKEDQRQKKMIEQLAR